MTIRNDFNCKITTSPPPKPVDKAQINDDNEIVQLTLATPEAIQTVGDKGAAKALFLAQQAATSTGFQSITPGYVTADDLTRALVVGPGEYGRLKGIEPTELKFDINVKKGFRDLVDEADILPLNPKDFNPKEVESFIASPSCLQIIGLSKELVRLINNSGVKGQNPSNRIRDTDGFYAVEIKPENLKKIQDTIAKLQTSIKDYDGLNNPPLKADQFFNIRGFLDRLPSIMQERFENTKLLTLAQQASAMVQNAMADHNRSDDFVL